MERAIFEDKNKEQNKGKDKMKKYLLLTIILILCASYSYAQECDYAEYEEVETIKIESYIDGKLVKSSPPFVEITGIKTWKESPGYTMDYEFYLENKLDIPVELNLYYTLDGSQIQQRISLDPYGKEKIRGNYRQDNPGLNKESIRFGIRDLLEVEIPETEFVENCIVCSSDEIFCDENKKCVSINEVPLDVKPECGLYQECVSQYINPETGLCSKSPAQLKEEEDQKTKEEVAAQQKEHEQEAKEKKFWSYMIIAVISLLIFCFLVWVIYDIVRKKTEIKKMEAKMMRQKFEIKYAKDLEKARKELDNRNQHYIKKYCDRYKLRIDDDGYFRFRDYPGKYLHHYLYTKKYYPKIDPKDLENHEIHHINAHKLNNENWNLIALPKDIHKYKVNHPSIDTGDWPAGIQALKKAGLKEKDFPKYVREHLRKNKS
ncbi:hypothetical protein ACFL1B_02825 [Nanoarchaeota archaeon]